MESSENDRLNPAFTLDEALAKADLEVTGIIASPEGIRAPVDKFAALREIDEAWASPAS